MRIFNTVRATSIGAVPSPNANISDIDCKAVSAVTAIDKAM